MKKSNLVKSKYTYVQIFKFNFDPFSIEWFKNLLSKIMFIIFLFRPVRDQSLLNQSIETVLFKYFFPLFFMYTVKILFLFQIIVFFYTYKKNHVSTNTKCKDLLFQSWPVLRGVHPNCICAMLSKCKLINNERKKPKCVWFYSNNITEPKLQNSVKIWQTSATWRYI